MIRDNALRYGSVSRLLHWGMAALLLWQLMGMMLKQIFGKVPITRFWVGTHTSVGTLLLALIVIRVIWALTQWHDRPPVSPGWAGTFARVGHWALYALMLIVPATAFLRMLGSGKPLRLFGVVMRPVTEATVPWLTIPADILHAILAWSLLVLIAGHIGVALLHRYLWRDQLFTRMAIQTPNLARVDT